MPLPVAVVLIAALPAPELPGNEPLSPNNPVRYGSFHYRVPGPVYASAVSPDGKFLAVAGPAVRVYELPAWRPVRQFVPPQGNVTVNPRALAFSPNGQLLALHRSGGSVLVYDLPANKLVRHLRGADDFRFNALLALTPGGLLALADADTLYLHDPVTGKEERTVPAGNVVRLSPDGSTFVRVDKPKPPPGVVQVGGPPGEAVVGDAATGKDIARLGTHFQHDSVNDGLAFAPGGKTFALVRPDGKAVELRDAATGKVTASLTPPGPVYPPGKAGPHVVMGGGGAGGGAGAGGPDVEFSADGQTLLLRLANGDVARWAVDGGKPLPRLAAGDGPRPIAVHALPDGKTVLTPTGEGWVRVWDAATGAEQAVPGRYQGRVRATPSPDGTLVAVSDAAGRLDLRAAATGRLVRVLRGPAAGGPAEVPPPVFSPDGRWVAFVGQVSLVPGGSAGLEMVRAERVDGTAGRDLPGHDDAGGEPIGFTPAGLVLVVGRDWSGRTTAWDPATGWGTRTRWEVGRVRAVSPDGRLLAAVSNRAVEVWDVATGKPLRAGETGLPLTARRPDERPDWPGNRLLAWSGDGRTLAVVHRGGEVDLFDPRAGRRTGGFTLYAKTDPKGLAESTRSDRPLATAAHLSPDGRWLVTAGPGADTVWEVATGLSVVSLTPGPWGGGRDTRFTSDGKALLAGHPGYAERVEVVRPLARKSVRPVAALWDEARDLGKGGPAVQAAFALVAGEDGRELLREKLPPAARDPAEAAKVAGWIADLGGDDYATREAATKELTARAKAFEGGLREALRKADSPEVRRRLAAALAGLGGPTPDEVRAVRVVQAAELTGTPEARALLEGWAGGMPGAALTAEAKASLARMGKK